MNYAEMEARLPIPCRASPRYNNTPLLTNGGSTMNVLYVTQYDAANLGAWSGLGYYIAHALENQGLSLSYLGSLVRPMNQVIRIKQRIYRRLIKSTYQPGREPFVLRAFGRQIA